MAMQRFLLSFMVMMLCFPAFAGEPPPVPKNKPNILFFNEQIDIENKEKHALQSRIKDINNELSSTKNKLISIAEAIQKSESDLKAAEQKIANMEIKKSTLEDLLDTDRASIAGLILALERIRRTPPEAMLAMDEPPYKIAQSAMIMGSIIPSINRHADKLNKNLEMLSNVTRELQADKAMLLSKSNNLKSKHKEMSDLLSKRKELYIKTNHDLKAREIAIQKISLQARSLQELVKRIDKEDEEERQRKKLVRIIKLKPAQKIIDDGGGARLPVSGIIRISYKQKDNVGAISKGITIEGREGSIVVAPMSGKIQFTGSFKRYGNIVIIEHANNYHSLVAGLGEIVAIVGDYIKSGEPIGILPNSSLIPRPTLYYELRKNGNPVNPSVKFPELG